MTRALVLAGPGTNREGAAVRALQMAGAAADVALTAQLLDDPMLLDRAHLLVIAGGFSYADALGAGRMFALDLARGVDGAVGERLAHFVASGRPVLGICNGFQVLVRAGLLPGALGHNRAPDGTARPFDCRWVQLRAEPASVCVWTRDIERIDCPIAHGEGRYVHPDPERLAADGQVALRYDGANPNGSRADIAGVCDPTGVVLGLMPHPEDHVIDRQHPLHRRDTTTGERSGLTLFRTGVEHARSL
jgi:phosphoribosylformylglycinamidine synthase subunit PurQ / glutaminase